MKTQVYNKLIRDNIPEIIKESGKHPETIKVQGTELFKYLKSKLQEELLEYMESEDVEELADMVEVIYSILYHNGISKDEFKRVITDKRAIRGSFEEGYILLRVTEDEDEDMD
ncbi:MAG: nucleoside triphosphate pyrophosphohydrolase [Clostridiales bacterium]|nr:nucleoside triphosphate pyrophosphohydrolase [Clostridiales bacterium]